ncbi:membrane biogenesis protein [archaeon]|jgi:uncharacterized protein|nr:membrane biogenesis protein [archaeon]MBT6762650.1 membrane biogenesis protein [archaeon]
MQLNDKYTSVFNKVPIFGMIHLGGGDNNVRRALEEIAIFEELGVDGAIVENYHGSVKDVVDTLDTISGINTKVKIGINILPNGYNLSFSLASEYQADFIQMDYVAGKYGQDEIILGHYKKAKDQHPNIIVLGGVWPKYYSPDQGSNLEADIKTGMQRAEAIVVTGSGTGKETPFDKIKQFREYLGNHPLVIGAGLNHENAYNQLLIADGAIVGSCFKPGSKTDQKIDRVKVRDFMDIVRKVRESKR